MACSMGIDHVCVCTKSDKLGIVPKVVCTFDRSYLCRTYIQYNCYMYVCLLYLCSSSPACRLGGYVRWLEARYVQRLDASSERDDVRGLGHAAAVLSALGKEAMLVQVRGRVGSSRARCVRPCIVVQLGTCSPALVWQPAYRYAVYDTGANGQLSLNG